MLPLPRGAWAHVPLGAAWAHVLLLAGGAGRAARAAGARCCLKTAAEVESGGGDGGAENGT